MALSIGFTRFVSSADATQVTGLLTFAPVGLSPTEHASLCWTHSFAKTLSGFQTVDSSVAVGTAREGSSYRDRSPGEKPPYHDRSGDNKKYVNFGHKGDGRAFTAIR